MALKNHPLRIPLTDELHSRPFPVVSAPAEVSFLAVRLSSAKIKAIQELAEVFGLPKPENAGHYYATNGKVSLKWEQHTEFQAFTLIEHGKPKRFDQNWLDGLRGEIMTAAHIHMPKAMTQKQAQNYVVQEMAGAEFEGLDHLGKYFQDEWIEKKLYMDENSFDPNMFKYINGMIEAAKGRPLMQFNRIDFRLAWIRKHYPNAKIIHIYRHPRDQYISTLLVKGSQPKDYIQSTVKNFTDHFYLKMWARALHYHFPFIKEPPEQHPYETFYVIWKLSYLYGLKHADYSVKFEELAEDPQSKLSEVFSTLNISSVLVDQAAKVVQKQLSSKWKNYGRDEWFEEIECYCEGILDHFFYSIN